MTGSRRYIMLVMFHSDVGAAVNTIILISRGVHRIRQHNSGDDVDDIDYSSISTIILKQFLKLNSSCAK